MENNSTPNDAPDAVPEPNPARKKEKKKNPVRDAIHQDGIHSRARFLIIVFALLPITLLFSILIITGWNHAFRNQQNWEEYSTLSNYQTYSVPPDNNGSIPQPDANASEDDPLTLSVYDSEINGNPISELVDYQVCTFFVESDLDDDPDQELEDLLFDEEIEMMFGQDWTSHESTADSYLKILYLFNSSLVINNKGRYSEAKLEGGPYDFYPQMVLRELNDTPSFSAIVKSEQELLSFDLKGKILQRSKLPEEFEIPDQKPDGDGNDELIFQSLNVEEMGSVVCLIHRPSKRMLVYSDRGQKVFDQVLSHRGIDLKEDFTTVVYPAVSDSSSASGSIPAQFVSPRIMVIQDQVVAPEKEIKDGYLTLDAAEFTQLETQFQIFVLKLDDGTIQDAGVTATQEFDYLNVTKNLSIMNSMDFQNPDKRSINTQLLRGHDVRQLHLPTIRRSGLFYRQDLSISQEHAFVPVVEYKPWSYYLQLSDQRFEIKHNQMKIIRVQYNYAVGKGYKSSNSFNQDEYNSIIMKNNSIFFGGEQMTFPELTDQTDEVFDQEKLRKLRYMSDETHSILVFEYDGIIYELIADQRVGQRW